MAIPNTSITNNGTAVTTANKAEQRSIDSLKPAELKEKSEQVKAVMSGVTTFFSMLQQANSAHEQGKTKSEGKSDDEFIKSFQGALLGSLGGNASVGEPIEKQLKSLTSDESIEKLQSAFLASLQKNLFTAKAKATDSLTEGGVVESERELKKQTTLEKLEKLSFGENGLEINDGFDSVNVLNHVPVVSELYKNVTGRDISGLSKLAGGYLYGGPTGLLFSAIELTSQSLFDNSISSLIANIDYRQLFDSEQPQQKIAQQNVTSNSVSEPVKEEDASIHWENRVMKDRGEDKELGATAK